MEKDNTKDLLVIGMKVLAGVAISTVWFFSVPFVISLITGFFAYNAKRSGMEADPVAITITASLIGMVIVSVVNTLTHNLLKKLLKYSAWVYLVQSAHVYNLTLFGVIFGENAEPAAVALSVGIIIYLVGGVLLSAGIRKIASMVRKEGK